MDLALKGPFRPSRKDTDETIIQAKKINTVWNTVCKDKK